MISIQVRKAKGILKEYRRLARLTDGFCSMSELERIIVIQGSKSMPDEPSTILK